MKSRGSREMTINQKTKVGRAEEGSQVVNNRIQYESVKYGKKLVIVGKIALSEMVTS